MSREKKARGLCEGEIHSSTVGTRGRDVSKKRRKTSG